MEDPTWLDVANFIVGALVLGVLIWSLLVQRKTARVEQERRNNEQQGQLRAAIVAKIETRPRRDRGTSTYVVLHNRGPADARKVDAHEVSHPDGGELLRDGLPIANLPRDHRFPVLYIGVWGASPAVDLEITWMDDTGSHSKQVRVYAI